MFPFLASLQPPIIYRSLLLPWHALLFILPGSSERDADSPAKSGCRTGYQSLPTILNVTLPSVSEVRPDIVGGAVRRESPAVSQATKITNAFCS
ncbi:hypothetical protein LZ30DRAFT_304026 [Colletotrichum cereale]|nr:hypothetical protein LZ30DRAFT_304026 [Colletotrichum cereale]